jgi:hypothetical protein
LLKRIKKASEAFQYAVTTLERKFFWQSLGKLKAEFIALEHRMVVAEKGGAGCVHDLDERESRRCHLISRGLSRNIANTKRD